MDHMLKLVLMVVLIVLVAFLAPLLLQLYRTAKAVQALAESAQVDLRRISQEIHEARLQMDRVAGLAEQSLALPSAMGALAASFTRSAASFLDEKGTPWVSLLVTALKFGLDFLRRPREETAAKEVEK